MNRILTRTLDCFFLLRIPLLAPVWTILILGWITGNPSASLGGRLPAISGGLGRECVLWVALLGFSMVVASIYVINQIADIESDRINHKLFLLPNGILSIRTAWVCAIVCAMVGLGVCLRFLGMGALLLSALGLLLGMLYNLGPVALKNRAWGGTVANFLGHGVLTFLVGWYAAKLAYGVPVTRELLLTGLVASLSPGLANVAVFLTTTIPDAEGDKATGKGTFCVRYGERKTATVAAVACAGALALSFALEYNAWVMIWPSAVSLFLFVYLTFSTRRESAFRAFKWPVFLLSAFVVLFVPLYGVLILVTFFGSRLYYKERFGIDYPTFRSR